MGELPGVAILYTQVATHQCQESNMSLGTWKLCIWDLQSQIPSYASLPLATVFFCYNFNHKYSPFLISVTSSSKIPNLWESLSLYPAHLKSGWPWGALNLGNLVVWRVGFGWLWELPTWQMMLELRNGFWAKKGTVRKEWLKDEGQGVTIKFLVKTSERSKVVPRIYFSQKTKEK